MGYSKTDLLPYLRYWYLEIGQQTLDDLWKM